MNELFRVVADWSDSDNRITSDELMFVLDDPEDDIPLQNRKTMRL